MLPGKPGGESGFICDPLPDCEQPYYNDAWRSADGANWALVTESAGWSTRPGNQCGVIQDSFIYFGGFGYPYPPVTRTTIPGTARDIPDKAGQALASFRREGVREFTVQPAGKPLNKRWHGFLRIAAPE